MSSEASRHADSQNGLCANWQREWLSLSLSTQSPMRPYAMSCDDMRIPASPEAIDMRQGSDALPLLRNILVKPSGTIGAAFIIPRQAENVFLQIEI